MPQAIRFGGGSGFFAMPAVSTASYIRSIRSVRPCFADLLYLAHGVDSPSGLGGDSVDQLAGFIGRIGCSIGGRGKDPCHGLDHNISISYSEISALNSSWISNAASSIGSC
jgi:hypothetical protein